MTLKDEFLLNPGITFLNFGSFGSCPKSVFKVYQEWQLALEKDPVQFITVRGIQLLKESREALGAYINCHADDVVYVTNPSYAVNIIAKGLPLKAGDEILTTNLEYGACEKTWEYYCKRRGAVLVRQPISLPVTSSAEFIEEFFKGFSNRTKAIFISHITSTTGMILPVTQICRIAKEKGLITIVDGAHAPAHVDVDLNTLKADIYTGACHKWMMAPKGCSFLYVRKELQEIFDPLIISWGYNSANPSGSKFIDYHQGQGTRDFSAFLSVPACIEFMKKHNWKEVSAGCRKLVRDNAERFANLLGTELLCPITEEFIGQMVSFPVKTENPEGLQRVLYDKYSIEIPVMRHSTGIYMRYSINAFNSQADLDRLYEALMEIRNNSVFSI
jgi:isopenicillin-N epimerase